MFKVFKKESSFGKDHAIRFQDIDGENYWVVANPPYCRLMSEEVMRDKSAAKARRFRSVEAHDVVQKMNERYSQRVETEGAVCQYDLELLIDIYINESGVK